MSAARGEFPLSASPAASAAAPPAEEVKVTAEVGSLDTVKHMVAQGFGFAIASRAAILGEIRAA